MEREEESGLTHFIEHLCFKGTEKRSALDIAREIDEIGGVLNGFTGQEMTCFYVKVLPEHVPLALDILSDLVIHPVFDTAELEREREVVLREIKMVEDNPDELVQDVFLELLFPQDPLGRPVSGRAEVIGSVPHGRVVEFWRSSYAPRRVVLAAAGRVQMEEFREHAARFFSDWTAPHPLRESEPPGSPPGVPHLPARVVAKPLEEAYVCLGMRAYSVTHPRRYAFQVLNTYLGGGMSSRLFQEIREKRGLAYSIGSFTSMFADSGVLGVTFSTSPASVRQCLRLVGEEIARLKAGDISAEDVRRVKEQIRGNLFLGLESTDGWMARLAQGEIYFGRTVPLPEIIAGFAQVSSEEVSEVARDIFRPRSGAVAAVGRLDGVEMDFPIG